MNRRVLGSGLTIVGGLVGVLVLGLQRDPHAVRSPLLGAAAPEFTLPVAGGGAPISLAALRGRPVVLNFWATWCVPCHEEHAVLVAAARRHGAAAAFLGIVYEDDEESILDFLRRRGSAYPSLLDQRGKTAIAYGVYGVPETFFIDAGGTVVGKYTGPLDEDRLAAELLRAGLARSASDLRP